MLDVVDDGSVADDILLINCPTVGCGAVCTVPVLLVVVDNRVGTGAADECIGGTEDVVFSRDTEVTDV